MWDYTGKRETPRSFQYNSHADNTSTTSRYYIRPARNTSE
ncbi:hypothetical protein BV898_18779, partial [Hypsibius exemplaris]